jgi:hypothetical protein
LFSNFVFKSLLRIVFPYKSRLRMEKRKFCSTNFTAELI